MAFVKHVGRHSGTGQRLSVVFMQLPDEQENALVVYSDTLPDRYHDSFMEAIESNEGQAANSLYEVLGCFPQVPIDDPVALVLLQTILAPFELEFCFSYIVLWHNAILSVGVDIVGLRAG